MEGMEKKEAKKIEIRFDASFFAGLILGALGAYTAITLIFGGVGGLNLGGNVKTLKKVADTGTTGDSAAAPTQANIPDVTSEDYIRGDVNAAISIVEYSDTECPFCKRFHETLKTVLEKNAGKVNWVYRHFPLATLHSKAPKEAEALECAGELGGNDVFWKYTDRLYEITPSNDGLAETQLPEIAKYVGLDVNKFNDCLSSGKMASVVQKQYDDAVASGGRGTPYSIIIGPNGESTPISGALPESDVQKAIDAYAK